MENKNLWFKAKKHSWGWYPVSWQGWLVFIIYLVLLLDIFLSIDAYSHSVSDTLIAFSLPLIVLSCLFFIICYAKGESLEKGIGKNKFIQSQEILKEIKKAKSILLHCHPSPDPDCVGSALAMKFAIEQLGGKVTVISGDSEIPQAFMHFPGAASIVRKNFFEINYSDFDLFIVLDSGKNGVSRLKEFNLPENLKIINIDHHRTNEGCGTINIIDPSYPANCLILFDLFEDWGIKLNENISSNLFIGSYTDTGGFKYEGVTTKVFEAVAKMVKYIPNIHTLISKMQNTNTPGVIAFQAEAMSHIQVFLNNNFAIASVSNSFIIEKNLKPEEIGTHGVSSFMQTVSAWPLTACAVEVQPNQTKFSFRTSDSQKYDVSRIAQALGGGGHKAAAGLSLPLPIDEAVKKVVDTAKIIYNL